MMLRILGSPRTLCNGQTRRDFLHVGAAGLLVPVRDSAGRVVALLARRDDADDGRGKYLYLSSEKAGGPSAGAPPHVAVLLDNTQKELSRAMRDLGIREGEEKTEGFRELVAGNALLGWDEKKGEGLYPWAQCYGGMVTVMLSEALCCV